MKKIFFMSLLLSFFLVEISFPNNVEARGRTGSHRVGGSSSHGKGSHYVGGYIGVGQGKKRK